MTEVKKQRWYYGYFHKYCLAVSTDKTKVRLYMEQHRGLTRKEYYIEEKTFLSSKYDSQVLVPFFDMYLTKKDCQFITRDSKLDIDDVLEQTKRDLYFLGKVLENTSYEEDAKKVGKLLARLSELKREDEGTRELEKATRLLHPLVFCDITEYLYNLKMYEEQYNMRQEFLRKMEED